MKIYLLLLAVLLAGCTGSATQSPTAPAAAPSSTPQPTLAETAPEATEPPVEPAAVNPTPSPEPVETEQPAYPVTTEEPSSAPYPAVGEVSANAAYPAPGQGQVTIAGAEGISLVGTLFVPEDTPQPWPAVLLLHMLGSDKEAWGTLPARLAEAGYVVLALDMRGHGETGQSVDWALAPQDHMDALNFLAGLPGVDDSWLGIIGASIGANLALVAGADAPGARTVVLLSPGLDYDGVTTEDALERFGDRPLLILASRDDTYAADSSETLASLAVGEEELELLDGSAHGTDMLTGGPELRDIIIDWLDQFMK